MAVYERSMQLGAGQNETWAVLSDVERWPDWTSTMTEVTAMQPGPFAPGAKFRVRQPRLLAAVWTVAEVAEGRSFTWISRAAGVTSRADHLLHTSATGTRVTLRFTQTGPLARIVGLVYGRLIARFLETELAGLRRRLDGA